MKSDSCGYIILVIQLTLKKNKADRPANSRERWAGALMEVRSLFGLNSAIKKKRLTDPPTDGQTDGPTNGPTDGQTLI